VTNFERHIELVSCHTALDQAREELAAAKVSLADTAASLLSSVGATVKAQHQHEKAQAALKRVDALAATWADGGARLNELAAIRSAEGDDSLSRALAIGHAYSDALRAALVDPIPVKTAVPSGVVR